MDNDNWIHEEIILVENDIDNANLCEEVQELATTYLNELYSKLGGE